MLCTGWGWPVRDSIRFTLIHFNTFCRDSVAQEANFGTKEFCFLWIQIQLVIEERLKEFGDVFSVIIEGAGPYGDIVHVDMAEASDPWA